MARDNNNENKGPLDFLASAFSMGSDEEGSENQNQRGEGRSSSNYNSGSNRENKSVKITPESLEVTRKILDPKESTKGTLKPLVIKALSNFGLGNNPQVVEHLTKVAEDIAGEHAPAIAKYHEAAEGLFKSMFPQGDNANSGQDQNKDGGWNGPSNSSNNNKKVASNEENEEDNDEEESFGDSRRVASNDRDNDEEDRMA